MSDDILIHAGYKQGYGDARKDLKKLEVEREALRNQLQIVIRERDGYKQLSYDYKAALERILTNDKEMDCAEMAGSAALIAKQALGGDGA